MAFPFTVKEHRVPGQHIREYARATANAQEEVLELAVKEYIPREGGGGEGVTILAAHANGFPKVCCVPFSFLFPSIAAIHVRFIYPLESILGWRISCRDGMSCAQKQREHMCSVKG